MACLYPKVAWEGPNGRIVYSASKARLGAASKPFKMSCGGCMSCRIDKAAAWKLRLIHERKSHDEACFLTLTVLPDRYPLGGYLTQRDAQLFMKKLRKHFAPKKVRFFLVMEYGTKGWRSHFHVLLFGADFSDRVYSHTNSAGEAIMSSPSLEKLWGLGRVSVDDFTPDRAAYASGYAVKKVGGAPAADHYWRAHPDTGEFVQLVPEWMLCSKRPGIGFDWFDKFEGDAFPSGFLILDGRKVAVPEAYKRRWKGRDPELADGAVQRARDAFRPSDEERELAERLTEREAYLAERSAEGRRRAAEEERRIAAGELPDLEMRAEALRLRTKHRVREAGDGNA